MLERCSAVVLITALACTLGGSPALAGNSSRPDTKSGATTNKEAQPNEKLKADIAKLVADAKAGKVAPVERPQIQPAKSNNLSKRAKISIAVGIAVAVVAIVLIVRSPALNDGQ